MADAPAPPARRRILVVDDDPSLRRLVATLLSSRGYDVETAENGAQAMHRIQSSTGWDLWIVDIKMPLVNGLELLRRVREAGFTETPVLMLTGAGDTKYDEALEGGADSYITKPFSNSSLIETVEDLLSAE